MHVQGSDPVRVGFVPTCFTDVFIVVHDEIMRCKVIMGLCYWSIHATRVYDQIVIGCGIAKVCVNLFMTIFLVLVICCKSFMLPMLNMLIIMVNKDLTEGLWMMTCSYFLM